MSEELTVIEGGADRARAVLRNVSITGFKSFAHKTYLEFAPGITAIVGPNGVGKSNVSEAIRWALGEGAGRALRVRRGEDLIFAGSETRRAIGMAEVVLHLDNSAKRLPIDFAEVEIARRFFRSGESEYLVNRAKVRLRDLEDLLAGANLADNPFVVIGQGLVDQVLALRPQERRIVIEEAAGTRRLYLRREEALHKIAAAEAELVRVHDVLREISPRRALLEEQAAKWREYEVVRNELRQRALRWYRDSYGEAARSRDELRERLAAADAALVAAMEEVTHAEGAAVVDEAGLELSREREELARHAAGEAAAADSQAREVLAGLRSSLGSLNEQRDRVAQTVASLPAEIGVSRERLARVDEEAAAVSNAAREAGARLVQEERALAQRQAAASTASQQRLAVERELLVRESALAGSLAEAESLERRGGALAAEAGELGDERAAHARERDLLAERIARMRRGVDEVSRRIESLAGEAGELRGELLRLDGDLAIARGQRTALDEAVMRAREEVELRRAALSHDVPALPEGLWWLFERVRVPSELERAVRAALGGGVVVAKDLGRAADLRASGLRGVTVVATPGTPQGPKGPGVPLADALEPRDAAAGAVARAALAGIFLVEDERAAIAAAGDLPLGSRVVTRDGLVVSRGQVRIASEAADELAARRRLRQIEEIAERLARESDAAGRSTRDLEQQRETAERSLREREAELARAQEERTSREAEEADLQAADEAHHDATREIDARVLASEREAAELRARRDALARERETANAARAEAARTFARAESSEREAAEALREAGAAAAQVHLDAATAEERRTTLARLRDALSDQIVAAERRHAVEEERLAGITSAARDTAARHETAEREAARLAAAAEAARAAWDAARAEALAAEGSRRESEQRRASGRERVAELRGERARLAAEEERANAALRLLDEQVRAELGLAEDEALPDPSSIELGEAHAARTAQNELRELQRLRRKLVALEPVNPLAETELGEVAGRHDFLTAQRDDLERAIADLRTLADELARAMAEQFSATLQAVDREFGVFFARLMNGGTASLRVSEDEDEPGLDIVARPPGKRISGLAQLSGGERALTATALLLAILRVRPAPFCVLDEVDAALDERNIGRFTQALRELTDRTQFVVITHNRGTIEAADALYGMSMDNHGVSKVVSLRLADLDAERVG